MKKPKVRKGVKARPTMVHKKKSKYPSRKDTQYYKGEDWFEEQKRLVIEKEDK